MGDAVSGPTLGQRVKKLLIQRPQGINVPKMAWILWAVNITQMAVLALLLIMLVTGHENLPDWALVFICLTVAMSNVIMTRSGRTVAGYKQQVEEMDELIHNQDDLNRQLRMQRHDFINHLQVIYALLQMDESDQAMEYMDKVYKDLQRVGSLLKTKSSAVNGLLAAKSVQGEKRGIRMAFDITTGLGDLPLEDWELCRVLSNLIDNAMDAAESSQDAAVELKLWEDIQGLRFRVTNRGPMIPVEMRERIFLPGVTTKGDRGTGMGLHIVDSILREHGGAIELHSDETETSFEGRIPLQPHPVEEGDN